MRSRTTVIGRIAVCATLGLIPCDTAIAEQDSPVTESASHVSQPPMTVEDMVHDRHVSSAVERAAGRWFDVSTAALAARYRLLVPADDGARTSQVQSRARWPFAVASHSTKLAGMRYLLAPQPGRGFGVDGTTPASEQEMRRHARISAATAISVEYTWQAGYEVLRAATTVDARRAVIIDRVRFENYFRIDPFPAYGYDRTKPHAPASSRPSGPATASANIVRSAARTSPAMKTI
jgi:hypothetical protein